MRISLALATLLITSVTCQTPQQRSVRLVEDRFAKLKSLSSYRSTWCNVEARFTQPALARYQQMFPKDVEKLSDSSLRYTWTARESSCEVVPAESTPLSQNHKAFMETALCMLLQVYFVNSPFDELAILPANIESLGKVTRIKTSDQSEVGIFLPHETFSVETRTKSRGVLTASYEQKAKVWLPSRLEQRRDGTLFVVDDLNYSAQSPREKLESFWISVGSEQSLRHTHVTFSDCREI